MGSTPNGSTLGRLKSLQDAANVGNLLEHWKPDARSLRFSEPSPVALSSSTTTLATSVPEYFKSLKSRRPFDFCSLALAQPPYV
ncbi:unnamed protein product [Bathycoccus prasinos]